MDKWAKKTAELISNGNYLDQLQVIYTHEEGERNLTEETVAEIKAAFKKNDRIALLEKLLNLDKFPYKDSYIAFLRKDRTAIKRNPKTVKRICDRLYAMGEQLLIDGISQTKEANTRRGNQFTKWLSARYPALGPEELLRSTKGVYLLGTNEKDAMEFCNKHLRAGIVKRPDVVMKVNKRYIIGEAKFLSSLGGNQMRAFDDGIKMASNTVGTAYKIFILDGVFWIEKGSEPYQRLEASAVPIMSALLLDEYVKKVSDE